MDSTQLHSKKVKNKPQRFFGISKDLQCKISMIFPILKDNYLKIIPLYANSFSMIPEALY